MGRVHYDGLNPYWAFESRTGRSYGPSSVEKPSFHFRTSRKHINPSPSLDSRRANEFCLLFLWNFPSQPPTCLQEFRQEELNSGVDSSYYSNEMGKLGKKARKFAKKNLQTVLKRKRKLKSMFKKKAPSSKIHVLILISEIYFIILHVFFSCSFFLCILFLFTDLSCLTILFPAIFYVIYLVFLQIS